MMIIDQGITSYIDGIRAEFPTKQALLLPLLHAIQEKEGFISNEAIREAAQFLELAEARVEEVVTFYTMYQRTKKGTYHLQLCTNIACFLRGADHLMACLEKKLGIAAGETTKDGLFSLSHVECLAACGTAPVMQVNHDYHEELSEQSVLALVDRLAKEGRRG